MKATEHQKIMKKVLADLSFERAQRKLDNSEWEARYNAACAKCDKLENENEAWLKGVFHDILNTVADCIARLVKAENAESVKVIVKVVIAIANRMEFSRSDFNRAEFAQRCGLNGWMERKLEDGGMIFGGKLEA